MNQNERTESRESQHSGAFTVDCAIHFKNERHGRRRIREGEPAPSPELPLGTVPRISRLMALALRFEGLVRDGTAKDYADLARLGRVTRARITQIMNLLNLAPDIQEEILFLPRTTKGRDPITERHIRPFSSVLDWRTQRKMWQSLKRQPALSK